MTTGGTISSKIIFLVLSIGFFMLPYIIGFGNQTTHNRHAAVIAGGSSISNNMFLIFTMTLSPQIRNQ